MSKDKVKYKYQIIAFTNNKKSDGVLDIDIIPSSWITYDSAKKTCITPYPAPPYSTQNLQVLQQMVRRNMAPLKGWPNWPITLKGGAGKVIIIMPYIYIILYVHYNKVTILYI